MTKNIEEQIVRLVDEISEDEQNIRRQSELLNSCSKYTVDIHTKELNMYKESLERKMQLLRLLKS